MFLTSQLLELSHSRFSKLNTQILDGLSVHGIQRDVYHGHDRNDDPTQDEVHDDVYVRIQGCTHDAQM